MKDISRFYLSVQHDRVYIHTYTTASIIIYSEIFDSTSIDHIVFADLHYTFYTEMELLHTPTVQEKVTVGTGHSFNLPTPPPTSSEDLFVNSPATIHQTMGLPEICSKDSPVRNPAAIMELILQDLGVGKYFSPFFFKRDLPHNLKISMFPSYIYHSQGRKGEGARG